MRLIVAFPELDRLPETALHSKFLPCATGTGLYQARQHRPRERAGFAGNINRAIITRAA